MKPRNVVRALMVTGASIALCVFAAPVHAASAAPAANATRTSVGALLECPADTLCLYTTKGTLIVVPSGGSASYSPPLKVVEIANHTTLDYCVEVGLIIYISVPANGVVAGTHSVYGVEPGPACPG